MADAELLANRVERATAAVAHAAVGHDAFDADASFAEPSNRAAEMGRRGEAGLVLEHLDIGKPGRAVASEVDALAADAAHDGPAVAV